MMRSIISICLIVFFCLVVGSVLAVDVCNNQGRVDYPGKSVVCPTAGKASKPQPKLDDRQPQRRFNPQLYLSLPGFYLQLGPNQRYYRPRYQLEGYIYRDEFGKRIWIDLNGNAYDTQGRFLSGGWTGQYYYCR